LSKNGLKQTPNTNIVYDEWHTMAVHESVHSAGYLEEVSNAECSNKEKLSLQKFFCPFFGGVASGDTPLS